MRPDPFSAILLIGFGGPTKPEEVRPFLEDVRRGKNIPEERIEQVVKQYEAIGGRSPYNEIASRQAEALRALSSLPVYLGMRHGSQNLEKTVAEMKAAGHRRAIGFVLAPHRYDSETDHPGIEVTYVDPWYEHPLFIEAVCDRVQEVLSNIEEKSPEETLLIFTAHSIPFSRARQSNYVKEVEASARAAALRLGRKYCALAWQSRSGNPFERWLDPDVNEVIRHAAHHAKNVLLVPIGFLLDHAEVLYDLDIAARKTAEAVGIRYFRAQTVQDHPKFIQMMRGQVSFVSKKETNET